MIDLLGSAFGAIVWTGSLVLFLLFRRERNGAWTPLHRYFTWILIGWTALMLIETVYFMQAAIGDHPAWIRWFTLQWYDAIVKLTFRPVQAWATWGLVYYLLRPPLMDATPQAVAQIVMDWRGIIQSWNEAATDLLGWTAADAVGQELAELIIPEDLVVMIQGTAVVARDAHRQGLERFRGTGVAPLVNTRYSTIGLHKDGRRLPVDVTVSAHITPQGTHFLGVITPTPGVR